MSETIALPREPLLQLPGFWPDAVMFAVRTTAALLLAYFVSFAIQLDTASSAGLCVAIVAQPSPGMAMSKAAWRAIGTIIGGVAALALLSWFPQDRTMLLAGFALWLGLCTFVAALLRDFRSYGAVLCGYTVGIIAVGTIDTPGAAFVATLNRVAAILIGIACVAAVNMLTSRAVSIETLVAALQRQFTAAEALARRALAGETLPDDVMLAETGTAILALRTEAGYAALEMRDGRRRTQAALAVIGALLGMIATSRGLGLGLTQTPGARRCIGATAAAPADPAEVFVLERATELERQRVLARDSLAALVAGEAPSARVRLGLHHDVTGAALSAIRTVIAVGLGCVFCIYGGWSGATLLLVQQAAFTALLGMQPNPSRAALTFGVCLVPAALTSGVVAFLLLPLASGFLLFALALAPFVFVAALAVRHPRTAVFGPGLLLYLVLLLSPSNVEVFDLSAFVNNVLVQALAVLFMVLAFRLVLPVSRERRLMRVADAVTHSLRAALRGRARPEPVASARSRRFDRLAQAQVWLGPRTPARLAVLRRLCRFAEVDAAVLRAHRALSDLGESLPAPEPAAMGARAKALLAARPLDDVRLRAISGLHEAALLLAANTRALRRYGARES